MTNDNAIDAAYPFSLEARTAIVEIGDGALHLSSLLTVALKRLKAEEKDLTPKRLRQLEKAIDYLSRANFLCERATDEEPEPEHNWKW